MSQRFPASHVERFRFSETVERLRALNGERELEPMSHGFVTTGEGSRIELLPPIAQRRERMDDPETYLGEIDAPLGTLLVLLVQAGSAAMGVLEEGEMTRHKVIKKYMVRGKGRYQGTHLKTKGKSRYGSRLRLQKAVEFFTEINQKLAEWQDDGESFDTIWLSCPVRLTNELFGAKASPPFGRDDERIEKIPLTVRVPSFKELRRVCFELTHGTVRTFDIPAGP